jgi:translation initiation factor IF-2
MKSGEIKGSERGRCSVLNIFTVTIKKKEVVVPGVKVIKGRITTKCKAYIMKSGVPCSEPMDINFIKSYKKEVQELKEGEEGTIGFEKETEILVKGTQIIFYEER